MDHNIAATCPDALPAQSTHRESRVTTHPVMFERFEKMLKSKGALPEEKPVTFLLKCNIFFL